MSTEAAVLLVRRYFPECVSAASGPDSAAALRVLDELLSPDFVMRYNSEPDSEAVRGRDRHKTFILEHAEAYPDDRWTVEALVTDGSIAACQWRIEARDAETGNAIDVRAADFFTVRDGRLAELRRFLDRRTLEEQTAASA